MEMVFILSLSSSKRLQAASKVSLFIPSVLRSTATRRQFRKFCMKKHKVQVLKVSLVSPKEQDDQIKAAVHQSSGTELNDTDFDSVVKYLAENRGNSQLY